MATPTTQLQIDVDLTGRKITKITDPINNKSVEEDISLDSDKIESSKVMFNEKFNELNAAPSVQPPPRASATTGTNAQNVATEGNTNAATGTNAQNVETGTNAQNMATNNTSMDPNIQGKNEFNKQNWGLRRGFFGGGVSNRRLSRRRQRSSNKKKFLVRNKSKKMRRGKYTRKAK